MNPQKRAVKMVRDFFELVEHEEGSVRNGVRDLLTALRGPDDENFNYKCLYTAPIRAAVMSHELYNNFGFMPNYPDQLSPEELNHLYANIDTNDHYKDHIESALWTLARAGQDNA